MKTFEDFERKALEVLKKGNKNLTEIEKMLIAQYIYETSVPYDGFLLTYLNNKPELLTYLIKIYEGINDIENLNIVKDFVTCLNTLDLQREYSEILDTISNEISMQLDELDELYPSGEEDYSNSLFLLE